MKKKKKKYRWITGQIEIAYLFRKKREIQISRPAAPFETVEWKIRCAIFEWIFSTYCIDKQKETTEEEPLHCPPSPALSQSMI